MGPVEAIQPRFNYKNHHGLSNGIAAKAQTVSGVLEGKRLQGAAD
jgi:hypothetical protein